MATRISIENGGNRMLTQNMIRPFSSVPAVKVQHAWKSFIPGVPVLQNMNMTVPSGTIYGLLGSSGCGKTTLLSCIVGLQNVDEGEIRVFGANPTSQSNFGRKLGYMPQDITLYEFLTIKETLEYFGRLCGMTKEEIQDQIKFLIEFLKLPNMNKKITSLSGGQKRRCSLAASLIHNPELLILDEPTVGLDPLLRESIWIHLHELVKTRGTTVIITTHYVEEARQCHTIGLMRKGRLLVEQCPKLLLEEYKADLLEEIVIKLCQIDQKNSKALLPVYKITKEIDKENEGIVGLKYAKILDGIHPEKRIELKRKLSEHLKEKAWFRVSRVKAVVVKNYLNFFRNPILLLGSISQPILVTILVGLVFGREPKNLKFGVVNHEFPNWEVKCFQEMNSGCAVDMSCKYIRQLLLEQNGQLDVVQVESEEEAEEKIRLGQMWGYISIPGNYSADFGLRGMSRRGLFADNETLEGSVISARLDMSHFLARGFMMKNLLTSLEKYVENSVVECGGNPREAELEFKFSSIYGKLDYGYVEYILPLSLLLIINVITNGISAVTLTTDRVRGTLDRSRVAGVQSLDILLSYLITDATPTFIQALAGTAIFVFGFSLEIQGSTILFILISILAGINGQSFGFLVGMFCNDEFEALIISLFTVLPMLICVGLLWPLEAMPKLFQMFSRCLPLTMAGDSMRSITSRGLGITSARVWPGITILLGWTVFYWIFVLFKFNRK